MTDKARTPVMSVQQTQSQVRAKLAWDDVCEVKQREREGDFGKKYGALAQKLPTLILTNGLGQALAFLRAKGKGKDNEHQLAYDHVSRRVKAQMNVTDDKSLLEWLLTQDSATYRRATVETLAYLNWLKRFAEAELRLDEDGG
jgi:CRISPR-associated protein Cmr5